MKKSLISAAILASLGSLTLSGCFSSSSSTSADTTAVSGTVVDWFVKDALVFADFNDDGVYNNNDVKATSSSLGDYTLQIPNDLATTTYSIVAKGGTDTASNKPFNGVLKTSSAKPAVISPLSTMVQAVGDESRVRTFLGLAATADLYSNPVADATLFRASQQIATALSSLAEVTSKATNAGALDGTADEEKQNFALATTAFANLLKTNTAVTNSTQSYVSDTIKGIVDLLITDTASTANNNLQSALVASSSTIYSAVNTVVSDLANYTPPALGDTTAPADVVSAQTTAADAADTADDAVTATITPVTITVTQDAVDVSGTSGTSGTTTVSGAQ